MYGLQLQAQDLKKQHDFYGQLLGFPVLERNRSWFRIQLGTTVLDFETADNFSPRYRFLITIPFSIFDSKMDEWSAHVDIHKRRSAFHPALNPTWYFCDTSQNIVELSPSPAHAIGITGIMMIVNNLLEVSQQLKRLGLTCIFVDQTRCILQNPDDATQIVLIQTSRNSSLSSRKSRIIPTMKSSVFATVCVRNTPHFIYMVKTQ